MTVADHIAIIAGGELIEAATPREIYRNPRARFTAAFIGEKNLLQGRVTEIENGCAAVDLGHATVRVPSAGMPLEVGAEVSVSIASESVLLGEPPGEGMDALAGTFVERLFLGLTHNDVVRLADDTRILVRSLASGLETDPQQGMPVTVSWRRADARLHTF